MSGPRNHPQEPPLEFAYLVQAAPKLSDSNLMLAHTGPNLVDYTPLTALIAPSPNPTSGPTQPDLSLHRLAAGPLCLFLSTTRMSAEVFT